MIEHDGEALQGFDQELWARLGDYQNWNAREAFAMFRLLREANLRMLAALSPEQWSVPEIMRSVDESLCETSLATWPHTTLTTSNRLRTLLAVGG